MTENKRFKLSEPHGAYLVDIEDDEIVGHWDNDDDKIIDLLNSLNEENEQLEQTNQRLTIALKEIKEKTNIYLEMTKKGEDQP